MSAAAFELDSTNRCLVRVVATNEFSILSRNTQCIAAHGHHSALRSQLVIPHMHENKE